MLYNTNLSNFEISKKPLDFLLPHTFIIFFHMPLI